LAKEKHPRYIDGRSYPSDYFEMKETLLPTSCADCDNNAVLLHHIDFDIHNNKGDNLVPLCLSCHTIRHNKERDSYKAMLEARGIRV
jgi:hypothetical protein